MEKLNKLKKDINEKEEKIRLEKEVERRKNEIIFKIEQMTGELIDFRKQIIDVNVKNHPEPQKEIKVNNLAEIKFPENINVKNFNEIQFPKYPDSIDIIKPKWFSFGGIMEAIKELKEVIIKQEKLDPDKYKKKSEAIAVRLVTEDGNSFYNAGGGGGGGNLSIEGLATEETLQAVAGFNIPKYDSVTASYNDGTFTETYVFKLATVTVATITVIYTDITKEKLVSATKV